jgi:DNA topoisomerase-2
LFYRKGWLKAYDKDDTLDVTQRSVSVQEFVHRDLIHFSNYDNIRSIPSAIDGLKPSQRKVLYTAIKTNLTKEMKVATFAGYVQNTSEYHHGLPHNEKKPRFAIPSMHVSSRART